MAVKRVVEPAEKAGRVGHRGEARDLLGADDMRVEPHVAVLGAFREQHVEAVAIVGEGHAADMV